MDGMQKDGDPNKQYPLGNENGKRGCEGSEKRKKLRVDEEEADASGSKTSHGGIPIVVKLKDRSSHFKTPGYRNGNVILGKIIPDEILLNIFQHAPDKCLIRVIPYVCQYWHVLSRTWHLWKVRLNTLNIKVSEARLERLSSNWGDPRMVEAVQWLCLFSAKKGFNHNLLKNPSGADQLAHWTISGDVRAVNFEEVPVGCPRIPEEANLPTQHCFVSVFPGSVRSQIVSLERDFGITPPLLNALRPSLRISQWVTARCYCVAANKVRVRTIGREGAGYPVKFSIRWTTEENNQAQWHHLRKVVPFDQLCEDVSVIEFKNVSNYWEVPSWKNVPDDQLGEDLSSYSGVSWWKNNASKTVGSSLLLDISTDYEESSTTQMTMTKPRVLVFDSDSD